MPSPSSLDILFSCSSNDSLKPPAQNLRWVSFCATLSLFVAPAFLVGGCATLGLGGDEPSSEAEKATPAAVVLAKIESRLETIEKRLSETERSTSLARKDFSRFQHETQELRNQLFAIRKRSDMDARKRRSGLALDFDDSAAARVDAKEKASLIAPLPAPAGSFSPDEDEAKETPVNIEGSPAKLTDEAEEKMRLARYGEAVVLLSDVQTRFPQFDDGGRSLVLLAQGWIKLGEPQNALPALRQVYSRFPTSASLPDAKLWEARAHELMGTRQRALALYRELLATRPEGRQGQEARAALARLRDAE
jgi:TolA-binding protein